MYTIFAKTILLPTLYAIRQYSNLNSFFINEKFYTYKDFGECISKIRIALKERENSSKEIGLVVNDDIETYASIFALWLEGKCYVPLHPNQPIDRSMDIVNQVSISLILDSSIETKYNCDFILNTNKLEYFADYLDYEDIYSNEELAYILFTSGSTGKPKGVMISRNNIGTFMQSFWETGIQINVDDKCLQSFDLTFDVSVQSYLVPLTRGACIYTIPHDQIKYSYAYGLLEDHKLTFGAMAPSMIRYLRPYFNEINLPSMRYNILTAEASPVKLIDEWSDCIPNALIFNFYGPTEATIYCTYYQYKKDDNNKKMNGMLSIGKAMRGLNAIIIDEERNFLENNQKGELCICGDQLTPGYWNNLVKNKESFFELDLNGTNTRFYKTGDSCYFDDEGDIMLAGRLDYQVKIQGYRIELGEIEYHAREYLKGQNVIAVDYTNQIGNTQIAIFIESSTYDEVELLSYLNKKMPFYMIPSILLAVNEFPLNSNGKIDRIILKNKLLS